MTAHIVVIGGGPAGAVTAGLLAKNGFDVQLVYPDADSAYKAGETFPPNANALFERLKLSELLQTGPHIKCPGNQSSFGSDSLSDVDFIFSQRGLGWHIDRIFFEKQLLEWAQNLGVQLNTGRTLKKVQYTNKRWALTLSTKKRRPDTPMKETSIEADYVVDASGRSRSFVRKLSIPEQNFDQIAARIAVFNCLGSAQDHRTMIESEPDGWWYSSSTPNQKRVIMFFSAVDNPQFRRARALEPFLKELGNTHYIRTKAEKEVDINTPGNCLWFGTMPAFTSLSTQIQGPNWLAVGDAAMTFDPLSSQGLLTALESAEQAALTITDLYRSKSQVDSQLSSTSFTSNSSSYVQWAESTFQKYMAERHQYYSMEQRWPQSAFWQGHSDRVIRDVS